MNILSKDNDFIYVPERRFGAETFDGTPCPTEEAFELIGNEGLETIRDKIATMLEWRKEMHGQEQAEHYGFHGIQKFIDVKNEIVLKIGDVINHKYEIVRQTAPKEKIDLYLPKLVVPDYLKENHYEKLRNKNHYIIKVVDSLKDERVRHRYKALIKNNKN